MGSPAAKVLPRRCNTKGSNAKSKDCWKLPSCEGRCYLALRIHRPCRETEELLRLTDRFELLHLPLFGRELLDYGLRRGCLQPAGAGGQLFESACGGARRARAGRILTNDRREVYRRSSQAG